MTNILTFSDLHGSLPQIPSRFRNSETIIVIAGDLCNNYEINFTPCIKSGPMIYEVTWRAPWNFRKIDTVNETKMQDEWIEKILMPHLEKNKIDPKNVIALRGNHDWCHLTKFFPNSLEDGSKTIIVNGIKIGLLVGVLPIVGEWFGEITEYEIQERISKIDPDIDILISHCPPYGLHDKAYGEEHIGSQSLYHSIMGKSIFDSVSPYFTKITKHIFGHAHGNHGVTKHDITADGKTREIKFYNTAKTRFHIEIKDGQAS